MSVEPGVCRGYTRSVWEYMMQLLCKLLPIHTHTHTHPCIISHRYCRLRERRPRQFAIFIILFDI